MVAMQSVYSWVLALVILAVALPVMLLVALAVLLSSPGPILYRQTRTGKDGIPFQLYKFRSMRQDAETGTGAVWATKDDPRVTAVGYWLRKLRLDELPQLLNVIRGEMSLVGPRPERPEFVQVLQKEIPYYRQRLCVKPGITGWAQVNHKYGDTIEDAITKLEYDLYYIKNLAPSLDAYIMFHTIKTVLLGRGAQ
jgi:exopolysaccharide biosynthesis polyprenyl glycosylphosphotransferase